MKANTVSEVSSPAAAGFSTAATTGGGNGRGVLPATRPLVEPGRNTAALPGTTHISTVAKTAVSKSGFWFLAAMLFLLFDAFDSVLRPNGATVVTVLFMIVGFGLLPRETGRRPAPERAGESG
ncbi:hypothetical protein [Canibacter oris]|uniref:Uncharacterized protein n=1 Tax=Canibacter oris TaxID=1365628 RepID=A0A840DJE1_9MICO|nr:hypothetical protein [Canibacter oris]MBB4071602.1 hypothetical protein [Canibacter oris]